VLPTFYDSRTRLACEVLDTLRGHFKGRCLSPIRTNTRLAEAPSHRKTIFEHAPHSHGAEDYARVVDWLLGRSAVVAAPADAADTQPEPAAGPAPTSSVAA